MLWSHERQNSRWVAWDLGEHRQLHYSLQERRSTAARTQFFPPLLFVTAIPRSSAGCRAGNSPCVSVLAPFSLLLPVLWASYIYLSLPMFHLLNEVSKASFARTRCEIFVCQAQGLAHSRHSASVHSLLTPQKHISSENGSQQKIQVGNSGFHFTIIQECICFVHKRNISSPM